MYEMKGAAWRNGLAVDVENCRTARDVMEKAGLDWEVMKCPVYAQLPHKWDAVTNEDFVNGINDYKKCGNAFAIYRTDTNIPLGVVKRQYTPVQNVDAFGFFDEAIGKNGAVWQTAGYYGNGEKVYVCAKLPHTVEINGDPVENYLVFSNSHDGSSSVQILLTPMRVVCSNMLNAAIKNASSYISFRHTKSVRRSIDEAKEVLAVCNRKIMFAADMYRKMADTPMSDSEAQAFFGNVILSGDEYFRLTQTGHTIGQIINREVGAISDSGISMKKVNVLTEINRYYYDGIGQREIVGTRWGAYNAITGYYSNVDNSTGLKRMDSILYGDKSRKIELAGNLLVAA